MTDKQKATLMSREPDGVYCQGCGERLYTSDDLSKIEYVKTKRGSSWFFHTACAGKVWARKICWERSRP